MILDRFYVCYGSSWIWPIVLCPLAAISLHNPLLSLRGLSWRETPLCDGSGEGGSVSSPSLEQLRSSASVSLVACELALWEASDIFLVHFSFTAGSKRLQRLV